MLTWGYSNSYVWYRVWYIPFNRTPDIVSHVLRVTTVKKRCIPHIRNVPHIDTKLYIVFDLVFYLQIADESFDVHTLYFVYDITTLKKRILHLCYYLYLYATIQSIQQRQSHSYEFTLGALMTGSITSTCAWWGSSGIPCLLNESGFSNWYASDKKHWHGTLNLPAVVLELWCLLEEG